MNTFIKMYSEVVSVVKINNVVFSAQEKILFSYLLMFKENSGNVFPSFSTIQEALGIGARSTVNRTLQGLEAHGLIHKTKRKGTSNTYDVVSFEDFIGIVAKPKEQKPQPAPKQEKPKVAPVSEKKEYTNDPWDFGDDPNVPF